MDTVNAPTFLTPKQISDSLQISIRTLEDWRTRGYGPPFLTVGRHVRYPLNEFEAWVAAGMKGGDESDGVCGSAHTPS
ncbi:helix-turn-helix domain-containing protein [Microbacterium sp. 13-71-7]|jgi:predicted site-specific integrase-resolvase|uniref:helix-turn-helix transcriptional regulator n=1 Tax=Microbacterium sp. 13-71-7 TaxID=1970399 RepID=UPI00344FBDE1